MRLLIVNSSRSWCGVDQVCRTVSAGMRDRGHNVLNAVYADSDYRGALDREGLEWISVPVRTPSRLFSEWRRYTSEIDRYGPDVTHIHTGTDWASSLLLPRSVSNVTVATRHNGYAIGRTKARLYRRRFERVFAVSDFVRQVLVNEDGFAGDQVDVLPNPVALRPEPRANARERFARELAPGQDPASAPLAGSESGREAPEPFRVGYIGRYSRGKGIDVVHGIAHRLMGEADVLFYTAGRPAGARAAELMDKLGRTAPSNLIDLGFITDLAGFYSFVDVIVVPTARRRREAAGLTAMEAQVMGTPVVVSDSGALPEAVIHGENGFIVENNEVDAYVRHILDLRDDPDLRQRLACAGEENASRQEVESVLDLHEHAYRDLY